MTTIIPTSSSIYKLFDTHMGQLTDNHGKVHQPLDLQASLATSIQQASSYTANSKASEANNNNKKREVSTSQSQQKHQQELIEELGKLYMGTLKQSSFLRQNLWNMERFCRDKTNTKKDKNSNANNIRFTEEDINSIFGTIPRLQIERVLRSMIQQRQKETHEHHKVLSTLITQSQKQFQENFKKIASDSTVLPSSGVTHGGPKSTPVITVKVRVKVSGWRDKSGARLHARLWCPSNWKMGLKRGNAAFMTMVNNTYKNHVQDGGSGGMAGSGNTSAPSPEEVSSLIVKSRRSAIDSAGPSSANFDSGGVFSTNKMDFSKMDEDTMEAVALELVRPELIPMKKRKVQVTMDNEKPITPGVVKNEKKLTAADIAAAAKELANSAKASAATGAAATEGAVVQITKEEKKTKSRKRKSATTMSAKPALEPKPRSTFIPYIPSYDKPRFHPAILAPVASSSASDKSSTTALAEKESSIDETTMNKQRQRLIQILYNQILNNPDLSPTDRRHLLANEISSTIHQLGTIRSKRTLTKDQSIQQQIAELQAIYEEDCDIVPENCNTIGLWNWMKCNDDVYFDESMLETKQDVYDGLEGCWQPELNDMDDGNGGSWGTLLPSVKVLELPNEIAEEKDEANDGTDDKKDGGYQEPSPLFDRLQSLLVEEDGSDEEEDEDEDDLLSSLPSYSPEEFMFGPGLSKKSSLNDDTAPDDAMLDVSALSLDQRTFIQLRAAGLVDRNSTPFFPKSPTAVINGAIDISPSPTRKEKLDEESIDGVLSKMKSKLNSLHVENNSNVATLQRKAISHVVSRQQQHRNSASDGGGNVAEESILAKYKQLQKTQRQQKQEKLQKIRTSGRIKTGPNKFDGEQWLPW